MKIASLVLGAALAFVSVSTTSAQEPTNARVIQVRAQNVSGRVHRPAPVLLPPPRNVYQRTAGRDRAREAARGPRVERSGSAL